MSTNKHVANLADAEGAVVAPGLSTSFGAAVTGDKIHIGYIHKARGTGSKPHIHKNEQFNYVMQGALMGEIAGEPFRAPRDMSSTFRRTRCTPSSPIPKKMKMLSLSCERIPLWVSAKPTPPMANTPARAMKKASRPRNKFYIKSMRRSLKQVPSSEGMPA